VTAFGNRRSVLVKNRADPKSYRVGNWQVVSKWGEGWGSSREGNSGEAGREVREDLLHGTGQCITDGPDIYLVGSALGMERKSELAG